MMKIVLSPGPRSDRVAVNVIVLSFLSLSHPLAIAPNGLLSVNVTSNSLIALVLFEELTTSNINTDFFPFVSTLVENLSSCANALAFTLKINIAISPITNTDLHRIKQVNM